jgi:hypothetical protein
VSEVERDKEDLDVRRTLIAARLDELTAGFKLYSLAGRGILGGDEVSRLNRIVGEKKVEVETLRPYLRSEELTWNG